MISLLKTALIVGVMLLVWGLDNQLTHVNAELVKTEIAAEQLTNEIALQNNNIERLQREKQQAERLLTAQRLELQQLATDTKETQHAVQQHLAKAAPSRPNCNAERLPAAVISLLGAHENSQATGTDNTTGGINPHVP